MRLLARRTGREPDWRDKCPLEDRATAVGVKLEVPAQGKEASDMRAGNKNVISKEEAYLSTRSELPPKPASPPTDTPDAMRFGAESAIAFERLTWGVLARNMHRL